jgi:hypothetical protein
MLKNFPIDFVRQIIEQGLLEEHIKNPSKYFGGKNQVNLMSFYEQLQKEDEVNRYVEIYRDLTDQQNRTGLIMNGTLIAPENPTITNVNQCLIIPMNFTCSFRVKLGDRDSAIETINNLIAKYKGRHFDIAEFDNGSLLKVGTIANQVNDTPHYCSGDFLGFDVSDNTEIVDKLTALGTKGITYQQLHNEKWFYCVGAGDDGDKLCVFVYNATTELYEKVYSNEFDDIIMPPNEDSYGTFTPYKISLSFDSIRCDEPRNLNSQEYCVISFGGSATLVSKDVALGNDLTKVAIKRLKIVADTDIEFPTASNQWVEPLELPSGNNANTIPNQLLSNNFISNTHTDSVAITLQYTFILDKSIGILNDFYKYARYGTQRRTTLPYNYIISPNMIFQITEIWSYWGQVDVQTFKAKVIESIDIENTESDTLTIRIPFQLQGDNN